MLGYKTINIWALCIALASLAVLFWGIRATQAQVALIPPRPRLEKILGEKQESGAWLTIWHDKETGQEVACMTSHVYNGDAISCWLTGRSWK